MSNEGFPLGGNENIVQTLWFAFTDWKLYIVELGQTETLKQFISKQNAML
jgi:hypothetical protein